MPKNKNKQKTKASFGRVWSIWNFVEAALLLIAGGLCIGFSFTDQATQQNVHLELILAIVSGALIILDGGLRIIMNLLHLKESDQSIIVIGGFEITAGIVVMLISEMFVRIIVNFLAIAMIVIGTLFILFSILRIVKLKDKPFMPIMEIIFAAILIGFGVATLIIYYTQDNNNMLILILMGTIFAIAGIAMAIISGISLHRAKKKEEGYQEVMEDGNNVPVAPQSEPTAPQNPDIVDVEETEDVPQIEQNSDKLENPSSKIDSGN